MKIIQKMLISASLIIVSLIFFVLPTYAADASYYDETYRPQFHFTPEANWMNDPNGLVYYAGEYHMFYQYHPYSENWGPMHWGHAVSTDLVNWKQLPIALAPDSNGDIFSGSAVIDWNNTAGFGKEAMIAIYTSNGTNQKQSIAYSTDKGRTWTKYAGNPVIPNPGITDFRDPKVFWHSGTNKWVMTLAAGDRVKIYTSTNLKNWTFASDFGATQGNHGGVWECPDLFPLNVDGGATTKWVMVVSNSGAPAGGSGWQYFVGTFNGTTFINDNPAATTLWGNYGSDDYAGVTFSDIPAADGRRIMIPWESNWNYSGSVPLAVWRGHMGIPKTLSLKTYLEGVRLVQAPVTELNSLRNTASTWGTTVITPGTNILSGLSSDSFEIEAEFQASTSTAYEFGFKVRGSATQHTTIGYIRGSSQMFVDRAPSGTTNFGGGFSALHAAYMAPDANGKVKLRFYVDRDSVEVFGNDGKVMISDLIFPDRNSRSLELYTNDGNVTLTSLKYYPMKKAWGTTPLISNISGWTTASGMWADTIAGKQGRHFTDGFNISSSTGTNFTYSANIKVLNSGAAGLVFRSNANGSNSYVANVDVNSDVVKLIKFNNGVPTELGLYSVALNPNTNYNLKVVTLGTNIKVYLGSTLALNITDSSYASGNFGLNIWNSTSVFQNINKL